MPASASDWKRYRSRPRRVARAWAVALISAIFPGTAVPVPPPAIEDLLRGLDRASYLYLDTALKFACKERIVESGPGMRPRNHIFDYLFVYDKEKGFQDYRTQGSGEQSAQVNPIQLGV